MNIELFRKVDKPNFDKNELDLLKKRIESMIPTEKERKIVCFYKLFAKNNRYLSDGDIGFLNQNVIISKGRRWGFRYLGSLSPIVDRERVIKLIKFQEEMNQIERKLIIKNKIKCQKII